MLGLAAAAAPLSLAACAGAQEQADLVTNDVFAAWLEQYKAAWEGRDAAAAGAIFTEGATYHEMPFEAPFEGRAAIEAYWTRVTAGQSGIAFTYEIIACSGDRGVAHWHAAFTGVPGGEAIELEGVFVCTFADAQHVSALREWWHIRITPPAAPAPG